MRRGKASAPQQPSLLSPAPPLRPPFLLPFPLPSSLEACRWPQSTSLRVCTQQPAEARPGSWQSARVPKTQPHSPKHSPQGTGPASVRGSSTPGGQWLLAWGPGPAGRAQPSTTSRTVATCEVRLQLAARCLVQSAPGTCSLSWGHCCELPLPAGTCHEREQGQCPKREARNVAQDSPHAGARPGRPPTGRTPSHGPICGEGPSRLSTPRRVHGGTGTHSARLA